MMNNNNTHKEDLLHIKKMMERSGRFISLSGLSGIAAGICALIGAYFANSIIQNTYCNTIKGEVDFSGKENNYQSTITIKDYMGSKLFWIAILTFITAFVFSFFLLT